MNPRLLIIEGPDCSGKTTLAQFLAKQTHSLYWHMSGHPALHQAMTAYHWVSLESIEWNIKNGRSVVLDRSWPSEFVYGREFRPALVDLFPFKNFQDKIAELHGKYIFCMDGEIESRFEKLHTSVNHKNYDRGQFCNIVQGYQVLMDHMLTRPDSRHYSILNHGRDMRVVLKWV